MRETLIVIRVRDDRNDRPWWEALNLPPPYAWTEEETFHEDVYADVEIDFDRFLTPMPDVDDVVRHQEASREPPKGVS